MNRFVWTYKFQLILVLSLFVFHVAGKNYADPYQKPIAGDAQAYYAYLPATFIYADFSYGFIDEINQKHYPKSLQKSFLKPNGTGQVNKTFPGVAILYLPFFLIAHVLALVFNLDADGYSTIYQVLFDIGLWVYLFLGLVFLKKVLLYFKFSILNANLTTLILCLGTNLFFYSVYDQSVTHVYNFFLANVFVFMLLKFKENGHYKFLGWALFVLCLLGITRPTNILVLGLLFFFIPSISFYKQVFSTLIRPKNLLKSVLISLPILLIPFLLWKIQTGNWVVYSYGEEGFNFATPHFSEFIFSYLKGWLTYTPIAFLVLVFGFILLFKKDKPRFFVGISFYVLTIYIFSSWWCWYYGAGMGQRVMIDHYLLLGYLISLIVASLESKQLHNRIIKKSIAIGVTLILIGHNIAQAYQVRYGILSGGSATKEQYWDNFLVFEPKAKIYPHAHWALEQSLSPSLDSTQNNLLKGPSYFIEDEWTIEVSAYEPYSASVPIPIQHLRKGSKICIGFKARARTPITETRAVFSYGDTNHIFSLGDFVKTDEWVDIEFIVEPEKTITEPAILYFWNANTGEKVEIQSLNVRHFFADSYL